MPAVVSSDSVAWAWARFDCAVLSADCNCDESTVASTWPAEGQQVAHMVESASDVLRAELLAALSANTDRLRDAILADLARPTMVRHRDGARQSELAGIGSVLSPLNDQLAFGREMIHALVVRLQDGRVGGGRAVHEPVQGVQVGGGIHLGRQGPGRVRGEARLAAGHA